MDGNFKLIITLFLLITFTSCRKSKDSINNDRVEIIKSNMPILLDSLEHFDWTRIPVPKKFKKVKNQQFKIELIDSILFEKNIFKICKTKLKNHSNNNSKSNFHSFKLDNSFIQKNNFKNINLVNKSSNDIYTLTIVFSNLLISKSEKFACIVVTKKVGISMKKDIFFFEKKNNEWNYICRDNLSIG